MNRPCYDYPIFIFAALLIFGFGLFSRVSERSPISAAMVFVAVGMIAGPIGLGYLREGINAPLVKVLAEVTLVLVLCFDQPQYATRRATSVNSFP